MCFYNAANATRKKEFIYTLAPGIKMMCHTPYAIILLLGIHIHANLGFSLLVGLLF